MHADGSVNLARVSDLVERNVADGVRGLFVCGSTGEGASLTLDERRAVTDAFVEAAAGRVPVIVHVGHNCIADAASLARAAQDSGASAIAAAPPSYYRPDGVDTVADCLASIASSAPDLPLYYYHIPRLTGVDVRIIELLAHVGDRLPTLRGVKFSSAELDDLVECMERFGDRYELLFGADEMLLAGLAAGATAAVGSTYNFAAPLYNEVIASFQRGDMDRARSMQSISARMIRAILRYPVHPGLKATMRLAGVDCGPPRLPLKPLTDEQCAALERELRSTGILEWA
jgi:N-acetylneuraminate lyase